VEEAEDVDRYADVVVADDKGWEVVENRFDEVCETETVDVIVDRGVEVGDMDELEVVAVASVA
jgi:ABC-type enterochelin transport system ATPase subunit